MQQLEKAAEAWYAQQMAQSKSVNSISNYAQTTDKVHARVPV